MEMRGLMGGFYKISEWIMRLSVTNVLWIICSIPFVFLLVTGLFLSSTEDELFTALIMAAIVAPFFFFPATAALFAVARKWVMGEVDVPLFKTYFRGYKENYLQSMLGGLLYTLLFVIMYVNYRFYMNELTSFQLLSFVFIGLMVLLFISMFNYFSMMVHYHMKTFQLLKNAILITIGRPFRSLSTVIMSGAVVFISFQFTFLIPFFMGSIIATVSFYNFFLIYQKLQMQAEKAAAEEEAKRSQEEEEDLELARMDGASVKDESEQAK
ncbi:YesL family protein [Paenibacillus sp. 1P07SE]|uniref:YesL family protein n=1 Tax=Paenibacillus sp. 1P07SE TaxID=3132209 RepID=UPI0039A535D0